MSNNDQAGQLESPLSWTLRLYVVGQTPKSVLAINNLKKICDHYQDGRSFEIEVVDLLLNPELAERDQIVMIPTLVRLNPVPVRRVFGDLSNIDKVAFGLQL